MTTGTLLRAAGVALAACVTSVAGPAAQAAGTAAPASAAERLRVAKELFFDRKYAEARAAWEAVRAAGGPQSLAAQYWIARSSESLGEHERALVEYDAYLAGKPADRAMAEEARTSRVGLAARLYKQGRTRHGRVLQDALSDPSRTVRYFTALQASGLGGDLARASVPVLCEILQKEKDDDLVQRAQLGMLKADPDALARCGAAAPSPPPRTAGRAVSFLRVRIQERSGKDEKVSITVPIALADLVMKSLPDEAHEELKRKGYDALTFWSKLRSLGPMQIVDIQGEDGERIQVWTE